MMNNKKVTIDWPTNIDNLEKTLHNMLMPNELTDVTFICDDKRQFKAHKIVLSACSTVLKNILNDHPQDSSIIYLTGIQHQEMESILEFMYLGVATFYQERMNEFLNVAKNLEIKEICKDVEFDGENSSTEEPTDTENDNESESDSQLNTDVDINKSSVSNISESQLQQNTDGVFECNQCDSKFTQKLV